MYSMLSLFMSLPFTASNYVGFGLMDAYGLVSLAVNWTTVAPQLHCSIPYRRINRCVLYIILSGVNLKLCFSFSLTQS